MKKIFLMTLLICAFWVNGTKSVKAEEDSVSDVFYLARVEKILEKGQVEEYGMVSPFQTVSLKILDGDLVGQEVVVSQGKGVNLDKSLLVQSGDKVVLMGAVSVGGETQYQIIDRYRLGSVWPILVGFFALVIVLSRWQGVGSILGMVVSLGIVLKWIVPQILIGADPLWTSIWGCLAIMVVTIYLAHGLSKKTTIALVSTFITLVLVGILASIFVNLTKLTGLATEDAASLRLGPTASVNFQGLLLGGILIGALGVLDDVTTGLSAAIFELAKANKKYGFGELYRAGLNIGREHIASLVNTLVLAYAGAALPIFIYLVLNPNNVPTWVLLNDGLIVEEVVRTLVGSLGLVLAVPLTNLLACWYVTRKS